MSAVIPFAVGIASGERPGELQLFGIVLALAGVAVASREPADRGGGRAAGIGLALVAALGFGFYFVFADQAADASVPFAVATARGVSLAVAFVAALAIGASVRAGRSFLPALIVIGLCFVAPWVIVIALIWKFLRRRRRRETVDTTAGAPPALA